MISATGKRECLSTATSLHPRGAYGIISSRSFAELTAGRAVMKVSQPNFRMRYELAAPEVGARAITRSPAQSGWSPRMKSRPKRTTRSASLTPRHANTAHQVWNTLKTTRCIEECNDRRRSNRKISCNHSDDLDRERRARTLGRKPEETAIVSDEATASRCGGSYAVSRLRRFAQRSGRSRCAISSSRA